jgi:hypothetical protein
MTLPEQLEAKISKFVKYLKKIAIGEKNVKIFT